MKILVNAPAYFPSWADAQRLMWLYLASCRKHGISPALYGIGCGFYPGFVGIRILGQLLFLKDLGQTDYTHLLCTDGWDCLYLSGLDEITYKYQQMGAPPMLSIAAETLANEQNVPDSPWAGLFDDTKKYRYPGGGCAYIAEISYIIDRFSRLASTSRPDDVLACADGWLEGWFRPVLDTGCEIFQDNGDNGDCVIDETAARLTNVRTDTQPCVVHFGGGYVSPVNGKDDRMLPWAKGLKIV